MKKVIFASNNRNKVREVKHILQDLDIDLISLADMLEEIEIIEDGKSFEENALIKAKKVYDKLNIPAIADDSGLMVEQLNGEPGIYSARFAGENATDEDNNNKLLSKLKELPEPHKAKFVCAAVYFNGTSSLAARGEFKGKIIAKARGSNGFGYDPLFLPDGYSITLAEMEATQKNKISHRYNAFKELKNILLQ